ncbi:MAG: hypothetical protein AAF492_32335 [Verrucomicrobiota bacterium]
MIKPLLFIFSISSLTVQAADQTPGTFREDWQEIPPELPITQKHVAAPGATLTLHGPGAQGIKKSHHKNKKGDPWYVWSGRCEGTWALSLKLAVPLDLSGKKAVFRSRGKHAQRTLRLVLQLPDGEWIVSDQGLPPTRNWDVGKLNIAELTWKMLAIDTVTPGPAVKNPDLKSISAVGFTDLEAGGQSKACSRVDWFELIEVFQGT